MISSIAYNSVGVSLALCVIVHATPGRAQVRILHENQRLTVSDLENDDRFGSAVAISGDCAFVGVPARSDEFFVAGSAYSFRLAHNDTGHDPTDDAWILGAGLRPAELALGDRFGGAVALDGDQVLVGALGDDDNLIKF